MRRALITGVTGQDGSYLAELLLARGYEVHGTVRPPRLSRAFESDPGILGAALRSGQLRLHPFELSDPAGLRPVLCESAPDELYHLAGQSHVGLSFEIPEATCETTVMGVVRVLEMVRGLARPPRLFYPASGEIFGQPEQVPQDERTPMAPVSPYGCAKAFARQMVAVYRSAFGLYAAAGILYNHESPRRGESFVTRKICRAAAAIKLGRERELRLGDLEAERDWGHARDYVRAMWLMLQQERPDDYLIATGRAHRVRDVLEVAFASVGLEWPAYVRQDPRLMRRVEPARLVGDAGKARRELGWEPEISFEGMIREMTQAELAAMDRDPTPAGIRLASRAGGG